jgi:pyruvate formate lyase activating enzyme
MNVDPIEKKPLYHFHPGSASLSIASAGCNLECAWCQNHHLACALRRDRRDDPPIPGRLVEPDEVVTSALAEGCASISFTYGEPTIHFEHSREVGVAARARGVKSVFVTNGTMTTEVARDAARSFLDAANVDLKAMRAETYRDRCHAGRRGLDAVLATIETLHDKGVWVEVTTLVVPGVNDDEAELRDAARFLRGVDPEIPWHLSRYHPDHEWRSAPPTPVETLRRAREIGLEEGLRYVYTGNVRGDASSHTICPVCGHVLVRRQGFDADPVGLRGDGTGRCGRCDATLAGIGLP